MESAVTAPVSGHIKRVVVHEGKLFRDVVDLLMADLGHRQATRSTKATWSWRLCTKKKLVTPHLLESELVVAPQ